MFASRRLHDGATAATQPKRPLRADQRVILHFDYDCFYAACFEVERPELASLPLAVQQKQIIVTCNYEARKRGLYKLQLITEARKACPEVIIVLGEDLTRFRNYSKDLYRFLKAHIWSGRAEKLGFDEVWLDVTDMIDYNIALLGPSQFQNAWFCLNRDDPTEGFSFDASKYAGGIHPKDRAPTLAQSTPFDEIEALDTRLVLGSHLAFHLRMKLEQEKGFTTSVGISTNKLLSKLVGNVHKPKAQTTLVPPYSTRDSSPGNVQRFLDDHEVGKIPGIGHKGAQQIRTLIKDHPVEYEETLVTHYAKEEVMVREVRLFQGMGPELLETTLGGPGAPRGIGMRTWGLLQGLDDVEVSQAREVPRQVSIEDTYLHMHDLKSVRQQLVQLSASLIKRLRIDLTSEDWTSEDEAEVPRFGNVRSPSSDDFRQNSHMETADVGLQDGTDTAVALPANGPSPKPHHISSNRRWLAHPRTIRLSTRERKPQRSFNRISRSSAMPNFIFNLNSPLETLSSKLADEILLPMFTKLIPARSRFDVNLINIAATNMQEAAGESSRAVGRDIAKMFGKQNRVLDPWRIEDKDVPPDGTDRSADDTGHLSLEGEPADVVSQAASIPAAQTDHARGVADDFSLSDQVARQNNIEAKSPVRATLALGPDDPQRSQSRDRDGMSAPALMPPTSIVSPGLGHRAIVNAPPQGSEDLIVLSQNSNVAAESEIAMDVDGWDSDEEELPSAGELCPNCGALMPAFSIEAHLRFHEGEQQS